MQHNLIELAVTLDQKKKCTTERGSSLNYLPHYSAERKSKSGNFPTRITPYLCFRKLHNCNKLYVPNSYYMWYQCSLVDYFTVNSTIHENTCVFLYNHTDFLVKNYQSNIQKTSVSLWILFGNISISLLGYLQSFSMVFCQIGHCHSMVNYGHSFPWFSVFNLCSYQLNFTTKDKLFSKDLHYQSINTNIFYPSQVCRITAMIAHGYISYIKDRSYKDRSFSGFACC